MVTWPPKPISWDLNGRFILTKQLNFFLIYPSLTAMSVRKCWEQISGKLEKKWKKDTCTVRIWISLEENQCFISLQRKKKLVGRGVGCGLSSTRYICPCFRQTSQNNALKLVKVRECYCYVTPPCYIRRFPFSKQLVVITSLDKHLGHHAVNASEVYLN